MKELIVERFGVKIVIQYPANMSTDDLEELKHQAEISCTRIRNVRDQ